MNSIAGDSIFLVLTRKLCCVNEINSTEWLIDSSQHIQPFWEPSDGCQELGSVDSVGHISDQR